jgi:hypothetical protein
MDCIFEKTADGKYRCVRCDAMYSYLSLRQCDADPDKPKPPPPDPPPAANSGGVRGPGDHLHDAILKWVGEGPTNNCQCNSRITQMNAWGPTGCREHLDEIVGWLVEEAATHKWLETSIDENGNKTVTEHQPPKLARLAKRMLARKWTARPAEWICRRMVLGAISKVEKENAKASAGLPSSIAEHLGDDPPRGDPAG